MNELRPLIDFLLRQAGYATDVSKVNSTSVLTFENNSVLGFAFVVETAHEILDKWHLYETRILQTRAADLRRAGSKSWNVYCVFLTADEGQEDEARRVLRIEEDLERTRKIARAGISTENAVRTALISLLPMQSHPKLKGSDYQNLLEARIQKIVGSDVSSAFFGESKPEDIVALMMAE